MGIVVTRAGAKDTAGRDAFDRLTAIACAAFDAPHAMITVLDEDRAVFRAGVGLDDVSVPRLESVSHHLATLGPEAVFVIEDTHASADYRRHPLVTGEPCIRFFAGATVCDRSGAAVGAIGVMD
ncbi:MAG: hypothetical protein RSE34_07780, partial [Brevundimonas sp.]